MSNGKMFESPVQEGDVIYVIDEKKYYLVEALEAAGTFVKDFGAIDAGGKLEYQEFKELYPPRGFVLFARLLPVDDVRLYIRVARESMRGALENATYYVDRFVSENIWYHTLAEVWVLHGMKFYVDVMDNTGSGVSSSKVRVLAWFYRVREISEEEAEGRRVVRVRILPIAMGKTE